MGASLTNGNGMLGTTSLAHGSFVTVDIETTGSRPGSGGILEIGAVRIEACAITASFTALVHPGEPVPPSIRHLTGIDDAMVTSAPTIDEVIAEFRAFVGDAVLVAHNHRFDMGFLDYEAERSWGMPFPRPVLDTLALARRLHPELERHNLRVLAEHYGATTMPTHRALPDALATAEVLLRMLEELIALGMSTAADAATFCGVACQGTLARKLALATHLPDTGGVYLFRDEDGTVVLVGRAKSLRTRVRSHFYAPGEAGSHNPAAVTVRVDHVACTSALDAQLVESRLLARYRPAYNRGHGAPRHPLYLHVSVDEAYPAIRVTRRRLRSGVLLGPVSNEWAVRTLQDALTRHFVLRRCTGELARAASRACTVRGTGVCPEPCVADTDRAGYAHRVASAVAVFNGRGPRFRDALQSLREQAASAQRYEDAIAYRDAVRALDRTLSALDVAARTRKEPVTVIVEGDDGGATAIVLVHGSVFTTRRFSREAIADGRALSAMRRAIARAAGRAARDHAVTPKRLKETLIVDTYRQQHAPVAIPVDDPVSAARRVDATLRRIVRVPRKRHAAASAG